MNLICNVPAERLVMNEYSDLQYKFKVLSYSKGEIISEKMRSLMQRTMPRDLYDIWYLFDVQSYNIEEYILDFRNKSEFKKLKPEEFVDTVQNKKNIFKKAWEEHLVNQIHEVPDFEETWRKLGKHWRKFEKAF